MEDRWNTDTERRDMTVWLFDEESFVPVAMIKEGRSYSILTDQLGTPTEAYDAEGNEVWSRVLDMDGNVIEETGNKGMVPFLFQGQYYDRETGLAYNRFRYYSPKMGMYVSQDPIGLAGGILNLYGYVDDTNAWSDALGLIQNSTILGLNLGSRPFGHDAHHIVMAGSSDPNMQILRAKMKTLGIDINSADNGIWLPRDNSYRIDDRTLHKGEGVHSKVYREYVFNRLKNVRTPKGFVKKLESIKEDLRRGKTFYSKQ